MDLWKIIPVVIFAFHDTMDEAQFGSFQNVLFYGVTRPVEFLFFFVTLTQSNTFYIPLQQNIK